MAIVIQTSTNTTVDVNGDGDTLFLAEDQVIQTTNSNGIISRGENTRLLLEGDVISLFDADGGANANAVSINDISTEIVVGPSALITVFGDEGTGVASSFAFSFSFADGSTLLNQGRIVSHEHGIRASSSDDIQVVNDGTIQTTSDVGEAVSASTSADRFTFVNSGKVLGGPVDLDGDDTVVRNTGLIEVTFQNDAVQVSGPNGLLVNYGQIFGDSFAFVGGGDTQTVRNFGEMNDISMKAGEDVVKNRGVVDGDISLGDDNDTFDGRGGTVTGEVKGGIGNDTFTVDDDSTVLFEEANSGIDTVRSEGDFALGDNFENLSLIGSANAKGHGNDEDNDINGNSGNNFLSAEGGVDTVEGGRGHDTVKAGAGDDSVIGGNGKDELFGQLGDDILEGGNGKDTIHGSQGKDTLTGGAGEDVFKFSRASHSVGSNGDDITDFEVGIDRIDVSDMVAGKFKITLGSNNFVTGGAELRTKETNGGDTRVFIDIDGDGANDARINVLGVTGLGEDDFVL